MVRLLKRAAYASCVLATRILARLRPPVVRVFHLDPALQRKCEAVVHLLNQHGIPAERISSLSRSSRVLLQGTTDLWIGLWNSVPLELLPRHYIFWNGEPVHHEDWDDDGWDVQVSAGQPLRWHDSAAHRKAWKLAEKRAVAVWEYIQMREVPSGRDPGRYHFVPFGHAAWYEEVFKAAKAAVADEPEIDVLFFGWGTERRRLILDRLRDRGVNLRVVDENQPAVGVELERLIARSKIILGIYGYDDPNTHVPDLARFDIIFSNKVFVLSERTAGSGRDDDYEAHVTVCDYSGLVDACLHYLAHPELRHAAASRTYEWFKQKYPLESFLPFDQIRSLRDEARNAG